MQFYKILMLYLLNILYSPEFHCVKNKAIISATFFNLIIFNNL